MYTTLTIIIYVLTTKLVITKNPKLTKLYIVIFLSLLMTMFLYVYTDDKIDMIHSFGQGRFLFIPSLLISVLWGIIFSTTLKLNIFYKLFTIIIIFGSLLNNYSLINKHIDSIQYKFDAHKIWYNFLIDNANLYSDNTILYLPSYLAWPTIMAKNWRLPRNITVTVPYKDNWISDIKNWDNKYAYDFDYKKMVILNLTPSNEFK